MKSKTGRRRALQTNGFLRASPLLRMVAFFALWLVLTEGDTRKSWMGIGAASLATAVSFTFWPARSWRWSLRGFLRFWPYFLWQSLIGGIDVARRALLPSMPLQPAILQYRLRLRHPPAQAFLAWTIGLLPGTASIRLHDGRLDLHVLDERLPTEQRLREVEEVIGELFCREMKPERDGQ